MDEVRRRDAEYKDAAHWHYVNIDIKDRGYDPKRDGKDNIITATETQTAIIADKRKPAEQRVEALRFVIHVVGDPHQPLHVGDRNDGHGGKTCLVLIPESKAQKAQNLPAVWEGDSAAVAQGHSRSEYAENLGALLKPEDEKAIAKATPAQWANESHDIARDVVYVSFVDKEVTRLEQNYVDAARPVADKRLARGGVRLAMILNKTLQGPATRPAS